MNPYFRKGGSDMKRITKEEAARLIDSGMTVAFGGIGSYGAPETMLQAIADRYDAEQMPKDLTIAGTISPGNNSRENVGFNRIAKKGLIDTIIAAHFMIPQLIAEMIGNNEVAAYPIPFGVMMHLFDAIASNKPALVTNVGLRTFVDPRLEGCKANQKTIDQHREVVELVNIGGKETLAYKTFKIDACVIRAYASDETGNLSVEHSAIGDTGFDIAAATHNSGGIVIAEVKTVVKDGTLDPHRVKIPASLVDYVVVADEGMYSQGYAADFRPELSGEIKVPVDGLKPMAMSNRKIIARRGAMELTKGCVINLGIGIPSGIGSVAGEEGISATLSVEYGALGGVPVEGVGFGAAANPEAILDVSDVFQLYDGGFLSKTFLGFAEADMNGNVNSSKFGTRVTGPGGFIDISQNTKEVCFVGTFTAGGLKEEIRDGKLVILQEGRERKFLNKVQQVTFSGDYANEQGQKIMFITERAVFQLTADGLVLTEIAPGVDLEKDILDQMDFKPIISKDLKLMDEAIFKDEPMGLSRLLSVVQDNDADEKTA